LRQRRLDFGGDQRNGGFDLGFMVEATNFVILVIAFK